MTDAASRGAFVTTYELFCGAPLILNSVTADLLAWTTSQGAVGNGGAARRRSVTRRVQNAALGMILLGLHDAGLDGGPHLATRLATAQAEAERLCDEIVDAADDLVGRLIVYRLELHDDTVLPAARKRSADYARKGMPGDQDILLALGLALVSPVSPHWLTAPDGGVRRALIGRALEDISPSVKRGPEDRVLRVDLDDEEAVDLAQDTAGIVRVMRRVAEAGRIVLESVDHLPGTKLGGSSPSSTTGSTPRSEFAPVAGIRLPLLRDVDVADAAVQLLAEAPWAAAVIETMLLDLVGSPYARFRPTLLLGPPGAGKTRLARRICEVLGLHVTIYACAGVSDAAFGGTSRQWGTGRACVPLQAVKRAWQANPVIVLDEVEKAGTRRDNGRLDEALIPFLETESAARHYDPYVECPVDLSCVSYVATANSLDGIPAPLLDRMRVLHVPEPDAEHLGDIARRIVDEIRRERGLDDVWLPDLDGDELALIGRYWKGGSLRRVRRLVETVVSGRDALAPRH